MPMMSWLCSSRCRGRRCRHVTPDSKVQLGDSLAYIPDTCHHNCDRPKIKPSESLWKLEEHVTPRRVSPRSVDLKLDSFSWQFASSVSPPDDISLDFKRSVAGFQPISNPDSSSLHVLRNFGALKPGSLGLERLSPTDIYMGNNVGNCWFLSSLACIAEYPAMIKSCFVNGDRIDPYGQFYNVRFVKDGRTVVINVDSLLHVVQDGKTPMYSQVMPRKKPENLWVAILEKAYAKLHGSFLALEGGSPDVAFRDLTGSPAATLWLTAGTPGLPPGVIVNTDSAWEVALKCKSLNCLLTVSTGAYSVDKNLGSQKDNHAFFVLHLIDVTPTEYGEDHNNNNNNNNKNNNKNNNNNNNSKSFRLLHIRNPWRTLSFNGDWSEKSDSWRIYPSVLSQIEEKCGISVKHGTNDGAFWILWEDFLKSGFLSLSISFAPCGLISHHIPGKFLDASRLRYSITPQKENCSLAFFAVMQEDSRLNNHQTPHPNPVSITMVDSEGNLVELWLSYSDPKNMYSVICPETPLILGQSYVLIISPRPQGLGHFPSRFILAVDSDKLLTVKPQLD